jgi:hypothetical protein
MFSELYSEELVRSFYVPGGETSKLEDVPCIIGYEVITAEIMKCSVSWDVTPR